MSQVEEGSDRTPVRDAPEASESHAPRVYSRSPVKYGPGGLAGLAGGQPRSARSSLQAAWPEAGSNPSPKTPRGPNAGSAGGTGELRLSVAIAEMQRHQEAERRSMQRQIEHLERRLQEQIQAPTVGRERWADLQGSVGGLLEEMAALARRVEGLDEKVRLRAGACEELVRQRTRDLEQHMHAQQQKVLMASSTSEEMSKRLTARLRKLGGTVEEHAKRLGSLEDIRGHDSGGLLQLDTGTLEARMGKLEALQANLEDELQTLAIVSAKDGGAGSASGIASAFDSGDLDSVLRALERDLAAEKHRSASQLDEHSTALANMRVRVEAQEQRIAGASDRFEAAISAPLEVLRGELIQLRDRDRQDAESRLEQLTQKVQAAVESSEEALLEVREGGRTDATGSVARLEEAPIIRKLLDSSVTHERALRRLEEAWPSASAPSDEVGALFVRTDTLEHRLECLEQDNEEDKLADKADRAELLRVEASLQELSEPLRRLSQRTASSESRSAALERRVEQLQQMADARNDSGGGSAGQPLARPPESLEATTKLDTLSAEVSSLAARVIDVEGLLYNEGSTKSAQSSSGKVHLDPSASSDGTAVGTAVEKLQKQSSEVGQQLEQILRRLSVSECDMRALQEQQQSQGGPDPDVARRLEQTEELIGRHTEQLRSLDKDELRKLVTSSQDDLRQRLDQLAERVNGSEELIERHTEQLRSLDKDELRKLATSSQDDLCQRLDQLAERVNGSKAPGSPGSPGEGDGQSLQRQIMEVKSSVAAQCKKLQTLGEDVESWRSSNDMFETLGAKLFALERQLESNKEEVSLSNATHDDHINNLKIVVQALESQLMDISGKHLVLMATSERADKCEQGFAKLCTGTKRVAKRVLEMEDHQTCREQLHQLFAAWADQTPKRTSRPGASADEAIEKADEKSEAGAKQSDPTKGDETAEEAVSDEGVANLEEKIRDLHQQASEELQKLVSQASPEIATRLAQAESALQAIREDLATEKNQGKELASRVDAAEAMCRVFRTSCRDFESRLDVSEAASKAVREELMASAPSLGEAAAPSGGVSASTAEALSAEEATALEEKVRELQEHVTDELEKLLKQEQEVAALPRGASGGASAAASDGQGLEEAVQKLSREVSTELASLREQQLELGQVKSLALSLAERASQQAGRSQPRRMGAGAGNEDSDEGIEASSGEFDDELAGGSLSRDARAQVVELARMTAAKTFNMFGQEEEMKMARRQMGMLDEQVKDILNLVVSLQKAVLELRKRADEPPLLQAEDVGDDAPEGVLRLVAGCQKAIVELRRRLDDSQATTAAAAAEVPSESAKVEETMDPRTFAQGPEKKSGSASASSEKVNQGTYFPSASERGLTLRPRTPPSSQAPPGADAADESMSASLAESIASMSASVDNAARGEVAAGAAGSATAAARDGEESGPEESDNYDENDFEESGEELDQ